MLRSIVFSAFLFQAIVGASVATAQQPRVFLLDADLITHARQETAAQKQRDPLVQEILATANREMQDGPFSVMQKSSTPPSGTKHDYMSLAPYFWPDPAKKDGLPYIRHDGQHNPEIKTITDHEEFGRMGRDTRDLALAYYVTGDRKYSDRAALLLKTWFLNPETRMNPNLEYAQAIRGINTGRGIGIIESRFLTSAVDAIGLLNGSPSWSSADQAGMENWISSYLDWLLTSDHGKAESAAKNNHGTFYDMQVVDLALFLGKQELATRILKEVRTKRIAVQIEPDGREPLELVRTNAFGYSVGNLDGLINLARLGEHVGVDLWNFQTSDGRSIRAALNFLLPYATGEKKWDYQEIQGFHGERLLHSVELAAEKYHDPKYEAAAKKLRTSGQSPKIARL